MLIDSSFYSSWFLLILAIPFITGIVLLFVYRKTKFHLIERFIYLISFGIAFLYLMFFLAVDSTTGKVWVINQEADGTMIKSEKRLLWYAVYKMANGTSISIHSFDYILINDTKVPLKVVPMFYINQSFLLSDIKTIRSNKKIQNFYDNITEKGLRITEPYSVSDHSFLKYFGFSDESPNEHETVRKSESSNVSSWNWVFW